VTDEVPDERRQTIEGDPFCAAIGIELVSLADGTATTRLTVTEDHRNFHGTLHGGVINALADAAFGAASNAGGEPAVALETNISYLESVDVGTTLSATAAECHRRRRTAAYEVDVTDDDGTLVARFRGRVYRL